MVLIKVIISNTGYPNIYKVSRVLMGHPGSMGHPNSSNSIAGLKSLN
jgi:hypothetical protein